MDKAFPVRTENPRVGLLLVGHGTRNPAGLAEFFAIARQVADMGREFDVEPCFLELAEPDIATGVQHLLQRGISRLIVAPVLLFAAGHAKRDIPLAVSEAMERFTNSSIKPRPAVAPTLQIAHAPPLECHERILELSEMQYREALANRESVPASETLLIMIGRGSSYPEAIAEMRKFTTLRVERTPVAQAETCFVAIAEPTIAETLQWASETKYRRIVVQPHLLFTGDVLAEINAAVDRFRAQDSQREWIVAPYLGPSPLVAQALLDLARV
jgi:sirohydrochlorin cobaltochelatase